MERYSRNRLYVSLDEQKIIGNVRVLLGGVGIGSVIAECAVRFGFENLTIIDGDKVELSNLNRQNYTASDIGRFKVDALKRRLLEINPNVRIVSYKEYIDRYNVESVIAKHDIAINALDFKSDIPFVFDKICSDRGIPVLHPYNLGWAGFLTIVRPGGPLLTEVSSDYHNFELSMAKYVLEHCQLENTSVNWLHDIVCRYVKEDGTLPPPQLSIGSWLVASHCVNAMFNLATGCPVRTFPEFYLTTIKEDMQQ